MLKERWRILKYINVNKIDKATKIIAACCVLHNFCLMNNDNFDYTNENFETLIINNNNSNKDEDDDKEGRRKRDEIANFLEITFYSASDEYLLLFLLFAS